MKINFNKNEENLVISLEGRLDTTSAPELDVFLGSNLNGVKSVTVDCAELVYVSSAGLRVILSLHKKVFGALKLTNVQELVMEVLEITGFADILTIE